MTEILIQTVCFLLTAAMLVIESISDLKKREINIKILAMTFVVGIILFIISPNRNWMMLLGGIAEGVALIGISFVTREGIGVGDGLVLMCTGVLLGPGKNILMFFGACVICAVFSGILLITKHAGRETRIPFVPFLVAGLIFTIVAEI